MKTQSNTRSAIPLVLVSTSPRRISLLTDVGLQISIEPPQADESPQPGEKPAQLVKRLAQEKAHSILGIAASKYPNGILIAADTIVVSPNGKTILGKPKNVRDAVRTLKTLQGATHTVLTGYCILALGKGTKKHTLTRIVKSRVKMRKLSESSIRKYVATGEPMDKAGSYGAQGMGMALIEGIQGSYTNVVGLPITQVLADLEKEFNLPLLSWIS